MKEYNERKHIQIFHDWLEKAIKQCSVLFKVKTKQNTGQQSNTRMTIKAQQQRERE